MPMLYRFKPIYQERVWGGRKLEEALGRRIPANKRIGESWEIVDRPEAGSVVAAGPRAGSTLRHLLATDPAAIMGPGWPVDRPFPILVKWLDCRERLSLQVHPPQSVAAKLGGEPKTENWYIARAEAGAAVLAGIKSGVTRADFEAALREDRLEALVHRIPVRSGDALYVPSGRLHAIDAGNLILEIQQNSDTTYRVYDWNRVGLDGKPRQLHIEQSMACIDFTDVEPQVIPAADGNHTLVDCGVFRLRQMGLAAGESLEFAPRRQPRIISVVEGMLEVEGGGPPLETGANALLPWAAAARLIARGSTVALVTDHFNPA